MVVLPFRLVSSSKRRCTTNIFDPIITAIKAVENTAIGITRISLRKVFGEKRMYTATPSTTPIKTPFASVRITTTEKATTITISMATPPTLLNSGLPESSESTANISAIDATVATDLMLPSKLSRRNMTTWSPLTSENRKYSVTLKPPQI